MVLLGKCPCVCLSVCKFPLVWCLSFLSLFLGVVATDLVAILYRCGVHSSQQCRSVSGPCCSVSVYESLTEETPPMAFCRVEVAQMSYCCYSTASTTPSLASQGSFSS